MVASRVCRSRECCSRDVRFRNGRSKNCRCSVFFYNLHTLQVLLIDKSVRHVLLDLEISTFGRWCHVFSRRKSKNEAWKSEL
jgi:hypothetical protein